MKRAGGRKLLCVRSCRKRRVQRVRMLHSTSVLYAGMASGESGSGWRLKWAGRRGRAIELAAAILRDAGEQLAELVAAIRGNALEKRYDEVVTASYIGGVFLSPDRFGEVYRRVGGRRAEGSRPPSDLGWRSGCADRGVPAGRDSPETSGSVNFGSWLSS